MVKFVRKPLFFELNTMVSQTYDGNVTKKVTLLITQLSMSSYLTGLN